MGSRTLRIEKADLSGTGLIEASAGTGKTYSIANLYLRFIIEQGIDVRNILVVTFSKAATKELKSRIRDTLARALRQLDSSGRTGGPEPDKTIDAVLANGIDHQKTWKRLYRAMLCFDEAAIFTIHGFCQHMLQENAFESGALFDLDVLTNDYEVVQETVDDFWRQTFYGKSEAYCDQLSELKRETLLFIANELKKTPALQVAPAAIRPEKEIVQEIAALKVTVPPWLRQEVDSWRSILADLQLKDKLKKCLFAENALKRTSYKEEYFDEYFNELLEDLSKFPDGGNSSINRFAATTLAGKIKNKKSTPQHGLFDFCERLLAVVKEKQEDDEKRQSLKQELAALKRFVFSQYIVRALKEKKERVNCISFDDMLHGLRAALDADLEQSGRPFHTLIRNKFQAVLVDEFQDTDPVQYAIFQRLFGPGSGCCLYMIGDPKQSIYRFRGADIFAYLEGKSLASQTYTLDTNYRSEPGMVDAVNDLFSVRLPKEAFAFYQKGRSGKLEKSITYQRIKPDDGRSVKKPPLIIESDQTNKKHLQFWYLDKGKNIPKGDAAKQISSLVVREIAALIQLGNAGKAFFDDGEKTPLRPGDIAVLVNTHDQARKMQPLLRRCGIASVIQNAGNVFASREALEMLVFLNAAANPGDRSIRPLFATEMLSFTAARIEALTDAEQMAWFGDCRGYHDCWCKEGFMAAFRRFLADHNVRRTLLEYADGERRITNILHVAELLHEQETTNNLNMEALVAWLRHRIGNTDNAPDEHLQRLESDDDAVKLVTVHHSKGLEFPVVFCPFLWHRSAKAERNRSAECFVYYDPEQDMRFLDIGYGAEHREQRLDWYEHENLCEQLRLFYVAVTRAVNRCYLVWGRINQSVPTALGWTFSNATVAELFSSGPTWLDIQDRVEKFASSSNYVAFRTMPEEEWNAATILANVHIATARGGNKKPEARRFFGRIACGWGVGSFSWITRNAPHDPPRDSDMGEEGRLDEATAIPPDGVFALPKGADFGSAVHEIFEQFYYAGSTLSDDQKIARPLLKYGLLPDPEPEQKERLRTVNALIDQTRQAVIATPFDRFALADVNPALCKPEMEFYYRLQGISPARLQAIFIKYGGADLRDGFSEQLGWLTFDLRKGFMNGFIDLVFRHKDRYYILDWKTNHLGNDYGSYVQDRLVCAMERSYYILQYHVYVVALHLHLMNCLGKAYEYERDFGGVVYSFVRGMHPDHPGKGVYFDRPPVELVEALCGELVGRHAKGDAR